MTPLFRALVPIIVLLSLHAAALADDPAPAPTPAVPPDTVHVEMKKMGQAFHDLAFALQKGDEAPTSRTDDLALLATLKAGADASRKLDPKAVALIPAEQREAFLAAYRKALDEFDAKADILAQAITAGDWAAAKQDLAALTEAMKAGHHGFMKNRQGEVGWLTENPAPAPAAAPATSGN